MVKNDKTLKGIIGIVLLFFIYNLYTGSLEAIYPCLDDQWCNDKKVDLEAQGKDCSFELVDDFRSLVCDGETSNSVDTTITTEQGTIDYSSVNTFSLRWVDRPTKEIRDNVVKMKINVQNTASNGGSMKVQCSILDPEEHTWLQAASPIVIDNCVAGEPFTQTKIVELNAGQNIDVLYSITAPRKEGTYKLYCAAYEYCYSETRDPLVSDELKEDEIEIIGEECTETTTWLEIRGKICVDNQVVDEQKEEREKIDWDLEGWIKEHRTAFFGIIAAIFIIFMFWALDEPKPPAPRRFIVRQ